MNESELGKALLSGETEINLKALTEGVLRRDRRRIWILAAICFIAWMSVVMLPWATTLPAMAKLAEYGLDANMPPTGTVLTQNQIDDHQRITELGRVLREATIITFILSVSTMFVASLCTLLLVVTSRRATLRQINARLADISAQLRTLAVKST